MSKSSFDLERRVNERRKSLSVLLADWERRISERRRLPVLTARLKPRPISSSYFRLTGNEAHQGRLSHAEKKSSSGAHTAGLVTLLIVSRQDELQDDLLSRPLKKSDIRIVGGSIERPELIPGYLEKMRPKLLLLDTVTMSRRSIIRCFQTVRDKSPETKIILLLRDRVSSEWDMIILQYGVRGCLLAEEGVETYARAIRAVSRGEIWLPRRLLAQTFAERFEKTLHQEAGAPGTARLTESEKDVVKFVTQGLTNKQIARQLACSPETVKKHLRNIFSKLNIQRRSQLSARGINAHPTD